MATIISQSESVVTISALNFLQLPDPARPDFNIFVPCDVNALFDNLQLVIPLTDADPNDQSPPDQNQPTTGTFNNTAWRAVYENSIMSNLATTVSRYAADINDASAAQLKVLFEKIICELFLGYPSTDPRYTSANLSIKTDDYVAPWLNGVAGGDQSWGQKCFLATQFDTIATQLVTGRKYERVDTGLQTEHGQVQLLTGDAIGVRVKLMENADNFLHINFYLQQTDSAL